MSVEDDKIEILSGIRNGKTIGAPITILVRNKRNIDLPPLSKARPGHIDMAAAMKFLTADGRVGAERASARETVGRVIAGTIAKSFLDCFDIKVLGYTTQIGHSRTGRNVIGRKRDNLFYTLDNKVVPEWKTLLSSAEKEGDTLGGCFEVVGLNIPVGLGNHAHWAERFDARLAQAIMAIPAVKGVEIGLGFGYAGRPGSQAMDLFATKNNRPILHKYGGWKRKTNYAGGIEGGLTNGENIIVRAAVKPIPTLKRPLPTIDLKTGHPAKAQVESSDICAVPAASVIGEAVVAFEIAHAFTDRFSGKTLSEISRRFKVYQKELRKRFS